MVKKKFLVGGWGGLSDYSISSWPWFVKSQVLGTKLGLAKVKKSFWWVVVVVCLIIVSALGPGLSKVKC